MVKICVLSTNKSMELNGKIQNNQLCKYRQQTIDSKASAYRSYRPLPLYYVYMLATKFVHLSLFLIISMSLSFSVFCFFMKLRIHQKICLTEQLTNSLSCFYQMLQLANIICINIPIIRCVQKNLNNIIYFFFLFRSFGRITIVNAFNDRNVPLIRFDFEADSVLKLREFLFQIIFESQMQLVAILHFSDYINIVDHQVGFTYYYCMLFRKCIANISFFYIILKHIFCLSKK